MQTEVETQSRYGSPMGVYIKAIWSSRYFWAHLALADLRSKWRRSFMGMLWSIVQPLGMTVLLSIVFSRMFHVDIVVYAPYILSGIIVWEFISSSLTTGSLAFVQADAYIKQCKHPLIIYTLRLVLGNLIVLALASVALFGWVLVVLPQNISLSWFAILLFFPLVALIAWPLSSLLAYLGARFRDIPHAMGLMLQAVWFISPVYFEEKLFRNGGLNNLVDYNPIYHLLQILRAPLLNGKWPTLENYLFCIGTAFACALLAFLVGRKAERRVIFYL
jgi:lipopolysaccharide transport system permease protein